MSNMASIFKSISNYVKGSEEYPLGWEVKKIDKPNPSNWREISTCGPFVFYQRVDECSPMYMILAENHSLKIYYTLNRFLTFDEGKIYLDNFSRQLKPYFVHLKNIWKEIGLIKNILDCSKANPQFNPAHISIQLGLVEHLKQAWMVEYFNKPDPSDNIFPMHIACQEGLIDCMKELLIHHCSLIPVDAHRNTTLHYAARNNRATDVIKFLLSKESQFLRNTPNDENATALHVACRFNAPSVLKLLLKSGFDPRMRSDRGYPLRVAMEADASHCVEILCHEVPDQITMSGELPLHLVQSRETMTALLTGGAPVTVKNSRGETPVHLMIRKKNLPCIIALLGNDADPNAQDINGDTPLHHALNGHSGWLLNSTDNFCIDAVRALIVYGADVNIVNGASTSVRHLAARTKDGRLLRTLTGVGAKRCALLTKDCVDGCSPSGVYEGEDITPGWEPQDLKDWVEDCLQSLRTEISISTKFNKMEALLSLDGGGIRGILMMMVLRAIEKSTKKPIKDSFHWVVGTSTGGMVALGLCLGFSVAKGMGLYFRFKDDVFHGLMRPYSTEPLEKLLRDYFGEGVMTDITCCKLLITSVLGDRTPPDLFFYTNFLYPKGNKYFKDLTYGGRFPPMLPPTEQKIWHAARATSAAPTFFNPFGRMLDGGLMSNNPTLDAMTEIFKINQASQTKLSIVVSLGTGMIPTLESNYLTAVVKPSGIWDGLKTINGLFHLGNVIIDQATVSEGRPVEQAKMYCHMTDTAYVRFNPPISCDIPLDETSDTVLLRTLWEVQCYIHRNRIIFDELAKLLEIINQ